MENFLRKLALLKTINFRLKISEQNFLKKLFNNIEHKKLSLLSSSFEVFSKSKHNFKGEIKGNTFELMRIRKLNNSEVSVVKSKGEFKKDEKGLILKVEINGFHPVFKIIVVLIEIVLIIVLLNAFLIAKESLVIILVAVVSHVFLYGMLAFYLNEKVREFEYELRKEFKKIFKNE